MNSAVCMRVLCRLSIRTFYHPLPPCFPLFCPFFLALSHVIVVCPTVAGLWALTLCVFCQISLLPHTHRDRGREGQTDTLFIFKTFYCALPPSHPHALPTHPSPNPHPHSLLLYPCTVHSLSFAFSSHWDRDIHFKPGRHGKSAGHCRVVGFHRFFMLRFLILQN